MRKESVHGNVTENRSALHAINEKGQSLTHSEIVADFAK